MRTVFAWAGSSSGRLWHCRSVGATWGVGGNERGILATLASISAGCCLLLGWPSSLLGAAVYPHAAM